MSDVELKMFTPEGKYNVFIEDIESGQSRSGRHLLKIHVSLEGSRKVIYQAASPLIIQMILENKQFWVGKNIPIKITHFTLDPTEPDNARTYEGIHVRGRIT